MAILQAGEYPLWFQFTDDGPVLLETIDDAIFSAALVPWPLAPHARFTLAWAKDIVMAVNGDGFIRLSPWEGGPGIGLYRAAGGEHWQRYTVGAFVLLEERPVALLYRDDRFFDSDAPLPAPRLWTLDRFLPAPQPFALPVLDGFTPDDGWDIDALRRGKDGWYFRAVKKGAARSEIRMLRSADLARESEQVSLGAFQNAALPLPLSAAPEPLREMLAALFAAAGCGAVTLVSPEPDNARSYAVDREGTAITGFYSGAEDAAAGALLLAASPLGDGIAIRQGADAVRRFNLPPLPENFVYTEIGVIGDTIVAVWEEQDGYSIGAAGFMVVRNGELD